jgi:hypothetical protein
MQKAKLLHCIKATDLERFSGRTKATPEEAKIL